MQYHGYLVQYLTKRKHIMIKYISNGHQMPICISKSILFHMQNNIVTLVNLCTFIFDLNSKHHTMCNLSFEMQRCLCFMAVLVVWARRMESDLKKTVCPMQYRYNNSKYRDQVINTNKYPIENHKVYDYVP